MIATGSKFLARTCGECRAFMWNQEGRVLSRDRKQGGYLSVAACYEAGTEPLPRPLGVVTPCYQCEKVPESAPEKHWRYASEISDRSLASIRYHDGCEAVGDWPKRDDGQVDPLVKRHAAVIRKIREGIRRKEMADSLGNLMGLVNLVQ